MINVMNKLFNIRANEWSRIALILLSTFLSSTAGAWGANIATAVFLKQIGVEAWPWVTVVSSVLIILVTPLYSVFVDRVANDRLMVALYLIGFVFIGASSLALQFDSPLIVYPALLIFNLVWLAAFNAHFTTYINNLYDIHSAKRVMPIVTTGFRIGAIFAGPTLAWLTVRFAANGLIVLWAILYLVVAVLIWLTPYLLKEKSFTRERSMRVSARPAAPASKPAPSYWSNMQEGLSYVVGSPFLRWMAMSTFVSTMVLALVEYVYNDLLNKSFATSGELASYTAMLGTLGNVFILPFLLFGMSRLVARIGLANAEMIFPSLNFLIANGLVFLPGVPSASAGYLDRGAFRIGFQYPIDNLLFNAVPVRVKGRARAFLSGWITPLGSLLGGLLLLSPLKFETWFVGGLIVVLAIVYVISAWFARQQYSQALVKMLQQEDYSFLLSQEASELTTADPATLAQLQKKLQESTKHEITVFIAQLIAQLGGSQAPAIVAPVLRAATEPRTRAALLDLLVAADLPVDAVRPLYLEFVADPDNEVRQSAIAGLEELAVAGDKQITQCLLQMTNEAEVQVRLRVLTALVRLGNLYTHASAVESLEQILQSPDADQAAQAVRILGQAGTTRALQRVADHLSSPVDPVRLQAALAIDSLARAETGGKRWAEIVTPDLANTLLEKTTPLLRDPIERVRAAALTVLGKLGRRESHEAMVNALADSSMTVRETAVNVLTNLGKVIIPIAHPRLNSNDPVMRKMVAMVLSRINPREFGNLIIGTNVTGNLLTIYRHYGSLGAVQPITGYASLDMLRSALREQSTSLRDEIFYLLGAIREPQAIKTVQDSLGSPLARTRANAVEALETLTTPETARLIAPLYEPDVPLANLLQLGKETWDMEHPTTAQALRQMATQPDADWLRAMAIYVLGELGGAMNAQSKPIEESKPTPPARRPRRAAADLLGALMDSEPPKPEPKPVEPPAPVVAPNTLDLGMPFAEIETLVQTALDDNSKQVRFAAQAAQRVLVARGQNLKQEDTLLSTIEKIIFLKEVAFFQGMTIDQLKVLANVCEEQHFDQDARIFNEGEAGGTLYVVVNGKVAIEQEKRKGSFARLSTIEAHSYFGEMSLFDASPQPASAIAVQDTLTLLVRREPLLALIRQQPELSLELIKVLNNRLREANTRVADLTKTRPRELHKLFDQLETDK